MTKQQAKKIRDLCIDVDDVSEDCFYLRLAMAGIITQEAASGAVSRLNGLGQPDRVAAAFIESGKLFDNLDKYGIPCAEWCGD